MSATEAARAHVAALEQALAPLADELGRIERWGEELAAVLTAGGRLLVAGNGGSAAQAQHLTAELVGRYQGERRPFSAIALHAETSSLTGIANDYGADQAFARQVVAHGRPGDVLLALSTSGRSPNVLAAVGAASRAGLRTLALTGAAPNTLASEADEAVSVDATSVATVQEVHLLVIHLLCETVDRVAGAVVGA
jgi:D-sedoheptulose 7-phosphate isomerase